MDFKDWLNLAIMLWGAGHTSLLAYMKLGEYLPNLKIYLEWKEYSQECSLVIANMGRPITIQQIITEAVEYPRKKVAWIVGHPDNVRRPFKLAYGESETIPLDDETSHYVIHDKFGINLDILIYDSEGNEYRPTQQRSWDYRKTVYAKFKKLKFEKSQNYVRR